MKFLLRQGQSVTEHPQAAPARAGIYLPTLVFPQAGDWQLTLVVRTDGTNIPVELGTIKVYPDKHDADRANIPDAPEGVSFLKEPHWKILSRTEPATRRALSERVRLPARVRTKPGGSAVVTAPVSGAIVASPGCSLGVARPTCRRGAIARVAGPEFLRSRHPDRRGGRGFRHRQGQFGAASLRNLSSAARVSGSAA